MTTASITFGAGALWIVGGYLIVLAGVWFFARHTPRDDRWGKPIVRVRDLNGPDEIGAVADRIWRRPQLDHQLDAEFSPVDRMVAVYDAEDVLPRPDGWRCLCEGSHDPGCPWDREAVEGA